MTEILKVSKLSLLHLLTYCPGPSHHIPSPRYCPKTSSLQWRTRYAWLIPYKMHWTQRVRRVRQLQTWSCRTIEIMSQLGSEFHDRFIYLVSLYLFGCVTHCFHFSIPVHHFPIFWFKINFRFRILHLYRPIVSFSNSFVFTTYLLNHHRNLFDPID